MALEMTHLDGRPRLFRLPTPIDDFERIRSGVHFRAGIYLTRDCRFTLAKREEGWAIRAWENSDSRNADDALLKAAGAGDAPIWPTRRQALEALSQIAYPGMKGA
jgi:hypothetical protein